MSLFHWHLFMKATLPGWLKAILTAIQLKVFILWRYNCVCLLYYDTHLYYSIKFKHYIWLCRLEKFVLSITRNDDENFLSELQIFQALQIDLTPTSCCWYRVYSNSQFWKVHTKTFCIAVVLWTFSSNFPYNKLKHVISLYRIFW